MITNDLIKTIYGMSSRVAIQTTIIALLIIPGCKKNSSQSVACSANSPLHEIYSYPIGVAVEPIELTSNPNYRQIANSQFNSVTPENIFKPSYLHPERNLFYWDEADSLVAYCTNNYKRLHGHTLIWHQQLPAWITTFNGNEQEWNNVFKVHIQTIVTHFKGKVAAWDVVNEAFNEDGTLRNTIWLQKIGPTYIEKAYIYASEADQSALLFYNDFNLEFNPTKLNAVTAYFNNLRSRGVKIDGIGLQMHISIQYPEVTQIASALKKVSESNYKIHLSELDISVNPVGKGVDLNSDVFIRQANLLKSIVKLYNELPQEYQYGITFWGISDANSWIRSFYNRIDYPLLFDENYLPKPAYCYLKQAL